MPPARRDLGAFRERFHGCLDRRADALFELCDAVLTAGNAPSPAHLSLAPAHRRGWGSAPYLSEFGRDGEVLFGARFPREVESYRAFRFPWKGQPDGDPALAAERGPDNEVTLYASWNGATEVATWEVLAGPTPDGLKPLGSSTRKGFETVVTLRTFEPYVGVRAKDRAGRVLGTSKAARPQESQHAQETE
jgi:hypothetical protein